MPRGRRLHPWVSSNDLDLLMVCKPGLCGGWLPIWQQADWPTSLKITDDRAVALVAPPCPVIDTDHFGRAYRRAAPSSNHSQQGVIADWQHQPLGETRCGASAECQSEMVDDLLEACGSACIRGKNITKALGEYLAVTEHCVTAKATRHYQEPDTLAGKGQIRNLTLITTAYSPGDRPAGRTRRGVLGSRNDDRHLVAVLVGVFNNETRWNEIGGMQCSSHGADSFVETNNEHHQNCIKTESEPILHTMT
ncbi:hypothetical protein BLM14_21800 (plasmid) [Phyllobacterium zundukense]|nr:hypothetical protein BLM14_21800 [Phyllobacterium zundukense]